MKTGNDKVLYSHKSDEWETPQWLFDQLDAEFHFDTDACASEENHKCERYYTKEQDGISADWGGCRVWCNPPYSEVGKWVAKAFYESRKDNTVVAILLPARTDTKYFHNYIVNRSEIRFLKGRIKFADAKNCAPFPSMIVVFRGANVRNA